MYYKKSLSILSILFFSCVFCIAIGIKSGKAQVRGDSLSTTSTTETEDDTVSESDATRTESFFKSDSQTTAWGATFNQYQFAPDVGYGETGYGYEYTDPLTGAYVSYSTSGMGMGAVPLPVYGGMNSQFAQASYGPYAFGQKPTTQATPGYDTQSSIGGDAFGTQYSYQTGTPNLTALAGWSLAQNPQTAALGYGMLYNTAGYGSGLSTGISPFGTASSLGLSGLTSGAYTNPFATARTTYSPYSTGFSASPYTTGFTSRPYTTGFSASPYTTGFTSAYNPYGSSAYSSGFYY